MRSRAFAASLWNFAGNWGQQLVSVLIFLYLVRTLNAADFGLMSLAAAAIDIMTGFGRFGQVEALMQRRFVSQRIASTSFWLLFAMGTISLVAFILGAEPLGKLLGDDRVAPIVMILAPVPLIYNLTQVHEYFLRRNFQYKGIAIRNVSATTVGGIAAVIAANLGYGFYALVLQKLVFTIVYALSLAISYRWAPSLAFSKAACSRLSRSGFDVVAANIVPMLNLRIIDVFVGYYLGVVALGFLRTSGRLFDLMFQLLINPIMSVSISSLTAVKSDPEQLRRTYLVYLRVMFVIAAPLFGAGAVLGQDIIRMAAGEKWDGAVLPFQVFCLTAAALSVIYTFVPMMLSLDRTRTIRDQALLQFAATAATTFLAAQFSLTAVLVTHLVRTYVFAAIEMALMVRHSAISGRDFVREIIPPVLVTAAMGAGMIATSSFLETEGFAIYARFALTSIVGGIVILAVLFGGDKLGLWPAYTKAFTEVATKALRRRRGVPDAAA